MILLVVVWNSAHIGVLFIGVKGHGKNPIGQVGQPGFTPFEACLQL